jgi:hypothetical protein
VDPAQGQGRPQRPHRVHVDASVEDDTGQVLCKRFELLAAIGFGATAAVYRALDRETKSEVAVKILYKSLRGDAEAIRYFAQEGKLAARIVHPNLLRAHYYGQRRGAPFIVFELVPGTSLSQVAAMRPMPWRRLAAIVLQVLDALAKLHEEGVLHGDIQPDNVIVQQTTLGQDFAKVIDLGFASARACSRLTLVAEPSAEVHGTAGFIAPERLAGLEPDGRADLYSVGALMYFLLTTRPVPDISLAPEELGVPAPSIMAPGANIPRAIDVIVMRALSDVDDRYPTAADMAQALRDALTQPVLPAIVVHIPEATPSATAAPHGCDRGQSGPGSRRGGGRARGSAHHRAPRRAAAGRHAHAGRRRPGRRPRPLPDWAQCAVEMGCSAGRRVRRRRPGDAFGRAVRGRGHRASSFCPCAGRTELAPPRPRGARVHPRRDDGQQRGPRTDDPRVSDIRRAIKRCNPLVPYSVSTITVKTRPSGKTLILFGAHEARGQLGTCVAKIAAQTTIAKGERLSFKL